MINLFKLSVPIALVLADCMFLEICPYLLGCPIYWKKCHPDPGSLRKNFLHSLQYAICCISNYSTNGSDSDPYINYCHCPLSACLFTEHATDQVAFDAAVAC